MGDPKFCEDCRHFVRYTVSDNVQGLDRCKKFLSTPLARDMVRKDDSPRWAYCDLCREDEGRCGISGKAFEPLDREVTP